MTASSLWQQVFFTRKLRPIQGREMPVAGQEVGEGALLGDAAIVEDENSVGAAYGGEPMGDDKRGTPRHQRLQALHDARFGQHIQGGGRLIEDEDGRITEQCPGNGDAELFAGREGGAAFANDGVEALRQALEEVVELGERGSPLDLLHGGFWPAIGDVVAHAGWEDQRRLEHHGHLLAQQTQSEVTDICPVQQHAAFGGVVKARDQADHGGLPCSRGADNGREVAGVGLEINAFENKAAVVVAETDVLEGNSATHLLAAQAARAVHQVWGGLEDLKDALGTHPPPLDQSPGLHQGTDGPVE